MGVPREVKNKTKPLLFGISMAQSTQCSGGGGWTVNRPMGSPGRTPTTGQK